MTFEKFEAEAIQLIPPNELPYFKTISKSVLPENYTVFLILLSKGNTVLAAYRAADLVKDISSRFGLKAEDITTFILPQFLRLYCTLKINKIELGYPKALSEEFTTENLEKDVQKMMDEIT